MCPYVSVCVPLWMSECESLRLSVYMHLRVSLVVPLWMSECVRLCVYLFAPMDV